MCTRIKTKPIVTPIEEVKDISAQDALEKKILKEECDDDEDEDLFEALQ